MYVYIPSLYKFSFHKKTHKVENMFIHTVETEAKNGAGSWKLNIQPNLILGMHVKIEGPNKQWCVSCMYNCKWCSRQNMLDLEGGREAN